MKITKELQIDMGHCVPTQANEGGTPGPCTSYHGHRYRLIITVDDKVIADDQRNGGMVIDFRDLKKAMMETIHDKYDHAFVLWEGDPTVNLFFELAKLKPYPDRHFAVPYVPTAENLAKAWFVELDTELRGKYKIDLKALEVFETPTSSAIYTRENLEEDKRKESN